MILIATQCFSPITGGMESLMTGLATAIKNKGIDIVVLADGRKNTAEIAYDRTCSYPIQRFSGFKPLRKYLKTKAIKKLIQKYDIEAIFTDSWKSAETVINVAQHNKIPVITLAHGNELLTQNRNSRAIRIKNILSKVDTIIANSIYTAGLVKKLGIDPQLVTVVHPGVTPPPSPSDETISRVSHWFEPYDPILLTIARLEPRKGHDQVIRCLPRLLNTYPNLGYLIAGNGPDRERLESLARELNLMDNVIFLGRVSEEEKTALLKQADLFVMPVRDDMEGHSVEGFGIAYIEAAFIELPALAGQSGGVPDAVVNGETGILCDGTKIEEIATTIQQYLTNPQDKTTMGEAAKKRAETEFTWAVVVERYLATIQKT